jgi:ABC-type glycerol-3-phosphate transport system permease component
MEVKIVKVTSIRRIYTSINNENILRLAATIVLAIMVSILLLPILWMGLAAFKKDIELFASPPPLLPPNPTIEPFQYLLNTPRYIKMLGNSYLIASSVTILCVGLAFLAAYGFSRYRIKGGNYLLLITLLSLMFPQVSLIIPYYNIFNSLGLYDTYLALILADTSFLLPFCIWMFKGYLDSIPTDLEEAAMVDGANRLTALIQVVLPLTLPGFIAVAIYAFLGAWNEYTFAVVLTRSDAMMPVTVGIGEFFGLFTVKWSQMSALALMASLPLMIIFVFLQKYLIEGMVAGAVKQ